MGSRTARQAHARGTVALHQHLLDVRREAHLAAFRAQVLAQAAQDSHQPVRAHVRLAVHQDALRRAVAAPTPSAPRPRPRPLHAPPPCLRPGRKTSVKTLRISHGGSNAHSVQLAERMRVWVVQCRSDWLCKEPSGPTVNSASNIGR